MKKKYFKILIFTLIILMFGIIVLNVLLSKSSLDKKGIKVTATFLKDGLDYIEEDYISCYIKPGDNSCNIKLPVYNAKGSYSFFWSSVKLPNEDLTNYEWDSNYFYGVGSTYELTQDQTFYPNINAYHSDWANEDNENYESIFKFRKFDISKSVKIGNTIFEFEKGIPSGYINEYIHEMKKVYKDIPWLFVPAKVFALTEETYNKYSIAYGLTQHFYDKDYESWNTSISIIDVKYDSVGIVDEEIAPNSISLNATIHELAHAWDAYYRYKNKDSSNPILISETEKVKELYDDLKDSNLLYKDNSEYISELEFFAGMVTNYYWHGLQKGNNKPFYALEYSKKMSDKQLKKLKDIIEEYSLKTN